MPVSTRRPSSSWYGEPDAYLNARVLGAPPTDRCDRFFTVAPCGLAEGHAVRHDDGFVPNSVELATRRGDFAWLSGEPDVCGGGHDEGEGGDDVESKEVTRDTASSETSEPTSGTAKGEPSVSADDESDEESSDESSDDISETSTPDQPEPEKKQQPRTAGVPWEAFLPPPFWYHPLAYAPAFWAGRENTKSKDPKPTKKKKLANGTPGGSAPQNPTKQTEVPSEKECSPPLTRGVSAWGVSVLVPQGNEEVKEPAEEYDEADERNNQPTFAGLGRYNLQDDLCSAVWSIAKGNLDVLQPVFYAHDAKQKGYLTREETRAMLRDLEPLASARQLDRVEAFLLAANAVSRSGFDGTHEFRDDKVPFPPCTLDSLVRGSHLGACAAARLDTPEGCTSAAKLVALVENALVADPELLRVVFGETGKKKPHTRGFKKHMTYTRTNPPTADEPGCTDWC
jgi:hypothetical protein